MNLLCENQTDWLTKDYYQLYVYKLNYILDVQISYYKLQGAKQADN